MKDVSSPTDGKYWGGVECMHNLEIKGKDFIKAYDLENAEEGELYVFKLVKKTKDFCGLNFIKQEPHNYL